MKFRKKAIVIEAIQFTGNIFVHPSICRAPGENEKAYIETLEGKLFVSDGDWIITGVNGEHYPCKPDIFEKTYDPIGGPDGPDKMG